MPKPIPFEDFLRRARAVHGDRYDYALAAAVWLDTKHKVPILCPVHGAFEQLPHNHLKGAACRQCGHQRAGAALRADPAAVAVRLQERYPHYDLDQASYRVAGALATWSCAIHQQRFRASFSALIDGRVLGCPGCREQARADERAAQRADPREEANLVRVFAILGPASAELYRRWLAGETLAQIGQHQGLTREGARQRLLRVQGLIEGLAGPP